MEKLELMNKIRLLEAPEKTLGRAIIFIPGISGNTESRFDYLINKLKKSYTLLLFTWETPKELWSKSFHILHQELDESITLLAARGCKSIGILGKSFGGGVALTYRNKLIKGLLLLAPAIYLSKQCNFENWIKRPFYKLKNPKDVYFNKTFFNELKIPVRILHGKEDTIVPLKNSEKLHAILPNSELIKIKHGTHKFKTELEKREVIEQADDFFEKVLR